MVKNDRGRGGGRFGRFQGRSNNAKKGSQKPSSTIKKEYIFQPQSLGKQGQTANFEMVKEYVVDIIQKSFKYPQDIALALEREAPITIAEPSLSRSTQTDVADREFEQKKFDMAYQSEYDTYTEQKAIFEANGVRAYSLIMQTYCSSMMHNCVEALADFLTVIKNNPIELLKAIRKAMVEPVLAKYPFATLTDTLTMFLQVKQQDGEALLDYVKRFKQARDNAKTLLSDEFLNNFVEKTTEYTQAGTSQAEKDAMKAGAVEQWAAYLLIKNSDQLKYGSLLAGLTSQYSLKNSQYPKTCSKATNFLNNHKWDDAYKEKKKKLHPEKKDDKNKKGEDTSPGVETSFAQKGSGKIICYCCGEENHKSNECPKKDSIPKKDWYMKKVQTHMQKQKQKHCQHYK